VLSKTVKYVNPKDLKIDPRLNPKIDEVFVDLVKKALTGEVLVYFGAVPTVLCVPYDLDFRPDKHEIAKQLIDKYTEDNDNNEFHHLMVYPRGIWFIVPDDYIELFATFKGLPAYVPCWIFGKTDNEYVKDIQGPIHPENVRKLLGF